MKFVRIAGAFALASFGFVALPRAVAHCDTLNGPVVQDARASLAQRDAARVLKWIRAADEPEVRAAFAKALAVRGQSPAAAELADQWFFETLVRLHRAGEGEPFTGLKAAAPDPAIAAADAAIANGDAAHFSHELTDRLRAGLLERFEKVVAARKHADDSVAAGREYVAAYVAFMHFAEQLSVAAEATTAAAGPAANPHAHAHAPSS